MTTQPSSDPTTATPPDSASGTGNALQRLALRGAALEFGGYGLSQVLRLGGNIVLTRLLFPEAFGLMALVFTISAGLVLLSDVGIQQSIIQNPRGEDPVFLNTAWTMHLIRGAGMWLVSFVLAYPASLFFKEPMLLWMLPIGGFHLFLHGANSTSLFVFRRRMTPAPLILMELSTQLLGLVLMITWSWLHPSVFALLIGGGTVPLAAQMLISHRYARRLGIRHRLLLDGQVRKEIFEFGRWILGSSSLTFLASQGDRILLGRWMGAATLGVFSTAASLADAASAVLERIIAGILYPLFSEAGRHGIEHTRRVYYQARLRLDALTMTAAGGLALMGPWVVRLLFDDRWLAAGWMLRVLAVRTALQCIVSPCATCMTSLGHSRYAFLDSLIRACWVAVSLPVAYYFRGVEGLVWAVALTPGPSILVLWPKFRSLGMLRLERELLALVFFAVGAGLGYLAVLVLPEPP